MTLILNYEGFEKHLAHWGPHRFYGTGIRYRFKFDNGYGASVVKHDFSYGRENDLWELAVLRYGRDDEFEIDYNTEITDDVVGWLTNEEVLELLGRIQKLNRRVKVRKRAR